MKGIQGKRGSSKSDNPTFTKEISFGSEINPELVGMDITGVKKLVDVFNSQITKGLHFGAQLVMVRHGQVVLDRVAGFANVRKKRPVTKNTLFHCFSITKPFTAICIHKLIEEGKIELDAPVAEYWPEFGCKGKETASIRHVFLHQAGIPSRGIYKQIPLWVNWNWVTKNVANLEAEFQPGSKTSYHLVNYGFILGEVVRRVTGKTIKAYLQDKFLVPLKLEHTYLGLPWKKLSDSARIYSGDSDQDPLVFLFNLPFIRGAVLPAATLNSTARDVATFFQMLINRGKYAGKQYVASSTILDAIALGYKGYDETIEAEMHWALGFHLGGLRRPQDPPGSGMGYRSSLTTFGHFGQNSSMVWADTEYELVVCLMTNRLLSGEENTLRFQEISDAVWDAIAS